MDLRRMLSEVPLDIRLRGLLGDDLPFLSVDLRSASLIKC